MRQITEKHIPFGRVEFFEDVKRKFFLAKPHGIINPSLLKEDVERARGFANKMNAPWTYITNTEDIKLVNPWNLRYLKEVKKIKNLKHIVIYVPNVINRALLRLTSFIVQPDRIITNKAEFEKFLEKVK